MTIVRKDFEIKLCMDEVDNLIRTKNMLIKLNSEINEGLLENEKESENYLDIKNSIDEIIINISHLLNLPTIISE